MAGGHPLYDTYTGKSHDDTQSDEQRGVSTSGNRNEYGGDDRDQNASAEHVLSAVTWRQPASEHLRDDVAVEKRAENMTAQFFAPFQLALRFPVVNRSAFYYYYY